MIDLSMIGLSPRETQIYVAVLRLGTCTVRDIARATGLHRTNIYDSLDALQQEALISKHEEEHVLRYSALPLETLHERIQEQQQQLDAVMPQLRKLQDAAKDDVTVDVYQGKAGMRAAFREMIASGQPLKAFGVRGQLREHLPVFAQQWLRALKDNGQEYRGIYTKREDLPSYYTEVRFVPETFGSPAATFIYGDCININIWEPTLIAIVIRSPVVAASYEAHFSLLWDGAKTEKEDSGSTSESKLLPHDSRH